MLPVARCLMIVGLLVALALPAVPGVEAQATVSYDMQARDPRVELDVGPGGNGTGENVLDITNTGNRRITVDVTIEVDGNVSVEPQSASVTIDPGETESIDITLQAELGTPAHTEDCSIRGEGRDAETGVGSVQRFTDFEIIILPYAVFQVEPATVNRAMDLDENRTFRFSVTNDGNANDTYYLNITGLPGGWQLWAPANVSVPRGEEREFNVTVRPGQEGTARLELQMRTSLAGSEVNHTANLTVAVEEAGLPGAGSAGLLAVALVAMVGRRRRR